MSTPVAPTQTNGWEVKGVFAQQTPGKNLAVPQYKVTARRGSQVFVLEHLLAEQVATLDLAAKWAAR